MLEGEELKECAITPTSLTIIQAQQKILSDKVELIETYQHVIDNLDRVFTTKKRSEFKNPIKSQVIEFIQRKIDEVSLDDQISLDDSNLKFTEEDILILKALIVRAKEKEKPTTIGVNNGNHKVIGADQKDLSVR